MLGIIGIIVGLLLLIFLVFKKVNLLLAALPAVLLCGLWNGMGFFETFDVFAVGMGEFFGSLIFVFLTASIYSQVLTDSGCAASIAYAVIRLFGKSEYSVLAVSFITALLVYGGISVFVVVFTVMPIGVMLLKEANINKSILPGLLNFGATTFAMTCLPGSPQLNNLIPCNILGTSPTASPVLGLIGTFFMICFGVLYYIFQIRQYKKKGRVFDPQSVREDQLHWIPREQCPPLWKAFLSLLTMLLVYLCLANGWLGFRLSTYHAVNTGMLCATLVTFLLNWPKRKQFAHSVAQGATAWVMPLLYLSTVIGLGAVIKSTGGFKQIVDTALQIPGNVYVSAAASTTLVAGITGSASGGIQIALESLASSWLARGGQAEVLHRICAVASGGLDSLPHAGGLFTVFAVCNESHKSGYKHIFYSTVMIPVMVTIILLFCISLGIY